MRFIVSRGRGGVKGQKITTKTFIGTSIRFPIIIQLCKSVDKESSDTNNRYDMHDAGIYSVVPRQWLLFSSF